MKYNHRNPQNRTRAAALLRQLKGQLVDVTGATVTAVSNTAASSEAHWQLSKASGVHVYQQDGGWHADLVFKDLPVGVPSVIGTPEPVATRAEAIESVVRMMSICAQRDGVPLPAPAGEMRWFRFDEHEVPIHAGLLADYVEQAKGLNTNPDDLIEDLEAIRLEITGGSPVTAMEWDAADFDTRYHAIKLCHIAMANGIMELTYSGPATPGLH